MRFFAIRLRLVSFTLACLLSACASGPVAPPSPLPLPSATLLPSPAAPATSTPLPSPSATPRPSATALPPATFTPAPTSTPDPVISLMAVGDVMLARQLGQRLAAGDLAYPFALVAGTLQTADLAVGNLECASGERGAPLAKSYRFRAPPSAAAALALAGFDLMTLANNHALDFGPEGLEDTLGLLEAAGVAHVGAGANARAARAPAILERNGLRVAFLGYADVPVERGGWDARSVIATESAPGIAWASLDQVAADVAAARSQADVVVVLMHSGYEYHDRPNAIQVAIAHAAIDAGAALVIGAHSHTLQGVERYRGGVIAYSLGNFAFEIDRSRDSAILHVTLSRQGVQALDWIPVVLDPSDGRPALAEGAARDRILANLASLAAALGGE
jgi:poly-gamma-glutamate synthesis protein (capsule biosynthesis protein)